MRVLSISAAVRGSVAPLVLTLLIISALTGCARTTAITLDQPFAPPSQRILRLTSQWAFSDAQAGRQRILLAFPLPGAEAGPRDFLLYLDAPDRDGDAGVGEANVDGARGFLIQAVGDLRGRTAFSSGRLRRSGVLFQSRYRRLELDLRCADGTKIFGTAYVEAAAHEVLAFEQSHAPDVATVAAPAASRPASSQSVSGPDAPPAPDSPVAPRSSE